MRPGQNRSFLGERWPRAKQNLVNIHFSEEPNQLLSKANSPDAHRSPKRSRSRWLARELSHHPALSHEVDFWIIGCNSVFMLQPVWSQRYEGFQSLVDVLVVKPTSILSRQQWLEPRRTWCWWDLIKRAGRMTPRCWSIWVPGSQDFRGVGQVTSCLWPIQFVIRPLFSQFIIALFCHCIIVCVGFSSRLLVAA